MVPWSHRALIAALSSAAMVTIALTSCTVGSSATARPSPRVGASLSASPPASPAPSGDPNVSTCGNAGVYALLPSGHRIALGNCGGVFRRDAGDPVVIHVGESVDFASSHPSFDGSLTSDDSRVVTVRDNVATGLRPGLIGIHSDDTELPCDGPDGLFTDVVTYCTVVNIRVEPDFFDSPR